MLQLTDERQGQPMSYAKPLIVAGLPATLGAVLLRMPALATAGCCLLAFAFLLAPGRAVDATKESIRSLFVLALSAAALGLTACGVLLVGVGATTFTWWMLAVGAGAVYVGWLLLAAILRGLRLPAKPILAEPLEASLATQRPMALRPMLPAHSGRTLPPLFPDIEPAFQAPRPAAQFLNSRSEGINIEGNRGCTIRVATEPDAMATPAARDAGSTGIVPRAQPEMLVVNSQDGGINIKQNENCEITIVLVPRNTRA